MLSFFEPRRKNAICFVKLFFSERNTLNIIEEGFKIKYNSEHWLGNGVYFFFDEALERWWTTNPTEEHGVKINNPALIKAKLSINKDKVIDLRDLHDFYKLIHLEKEFRNGAKQLIGDDIIPQQQYRCAFFDYIFQRYDIEIIIGTFHKMKQYYIDDVGVKRFCRGFFCPNVIKNTDISAKNPKNSLKMPQKYEFLCRF